MLIYYYDIVCDDELAFGHSHCVQVALLATSQLVHGASTQQQVLYQY
jgi:hypothetical protein